MSKPDLDLEFRSLKGAYCTTLGGFLLLPKQSKAHYPHFLPITTIIGLVANECYSGGEFKGESKEGLCYEALENSQRTWIL